MKLSFVFFTGSFVLNVVLLGVYVARRADSTPSAVGQAPSGSTTTTAGSAPGSDQGDSPHARKSHAGISTAPPSLWAALDSSDIPTLIARLRAAGFPPHTVREIVSARINASFAGRMKEIAGPPAGQPYWKSDRADGGFMHQNYETMNQLYRERTRMLREALADPFFDDAPLGYAELERRRRFDGLSRHKADAVQRIVDDYAEMASKVNAGTGGILLPEDREQLALLEREKRADFAAVLTPEELKEYEMRVSPITTRLRSALTLMDATEEEFRAIYAVQQPYADVLYSSPATGFALQGSSRREAAQQMTEQLKAALGAERYADFERANDRDFQQLHQIAQRENVSRAAALEAYALREAITRESDRIFDDPTITTEQKRAALQTLAQSTKSQMRNTLGAAAGDAYTRAANWVSALESGRAVSFGPGGTTRMRGLPVAENARP